jgi:hypothetical protein
MAHQFSPAQQAYFFARSAHEVALDAYQAECSAQGLIELDSMTTEECEELWNRVEDVRAKHNVDALSTLRTEAEGILIDWSLDHADKHAHKFAPEHRSTIALLRAKKGTSLKIWGQLVDIAARLAA